MYQYDSSKTTEKEQRLIIATRNSKGGMKINRTTITWKKKREEKLCMDIPSDKLTKSFTRQPRLGKDKEILRDKLNLF